MSETTVDSTRALGRALIDEFGRGWSTKEAQQHILAIRLRREFFDFILSQAVSSSYDAACYASRAEWQAAVSKSAVRLQWDPDHGPSGVAVERRAVQLGLRGSVLRSFGETEILSIEDLTPFVAQQRDNVNSVELLVVPDEHVYRPSAEAAQAVGIDVAA